MPTSRAAVVLPVEEVLHAAVGNLAGEDRPGQVEMATAVAAAMRSGQHLLVQAGTGTGKSLAYLVPAAMHDARVVVATATLALQHQLVERDIPALLDAAADVLGERPAYAVLKGRSNYACLHRIREGVPDDQGALIDVPAGTLGGEVVRLRQWAERESRAGGPGDRDSAPSHTDKVWQQVSVSHRECLGAQKCPYGVECFAERARDKAMASRLIVTNHSLLAIDAVEGVPMIPEYDVVVVDEAHELAARVTQSATDELSPSVVERAAKRARNFLRGDEPDDLADAGEALRAVVETMEPGRIDVQPPELADGLARVREAARSAFSAFPKESSDSDGDAARQQARGMVDEVRKIADRLAAHRDDDVVWLAERDRTRGGNLLCVAPLQVWIQLRDRLLSEKTVIFTSATLKLGGDFTALAISIGLKPSNGSRPIPTVQPTLTRRLRKTLSTRPRPPCRGERSTSVRRSTTRARASCTSPSTSRRLAAMGLVKHSLRRSRRSSPLRTVARSAFSHHGGPRKPPPRRCGKPCRTCRCFAKATANSRTCRRSSSPTRRSACSAPCRCGRGSTCRGRRASW